MRRICFICLILLPIVLWAQETGSGTFPAIWCVQKDSAFKQSNIAGKGYVYPVKKSDWELAFPNAEVASGDYVEVDLSFLADSKDAPRHYIMEYADSGKWIAIDTIRATFERPVKMEYATSLTTFRVNSHQDTLRLRLRAYESAKCRADFAYRSNVGICVNHLGAKAPIDTLRVLCIGNSFTHVFQVPYMLKQLAWSQGHYLDIEVAERGGASFANHLGMQSTQEAMAHGRYDYVFLQNQSQTNARIAQDTVAYGKRIVEAGELARRVRQYSPDASLIIESTWAYEKNNFGSFGSYEAFDQLMEEGTELLAKQFGLRISYIGRAFRCMRDDHSEINIYSKDRLHQNMLGSYLKACVNYQMLFGAFPLNFECNPNNNVSPDLWLSPSEAQILRDAACGY